MTDLIHVRTRKTKKYSPFNSIIGKSIQKHMARKLPVPDEIEPDYSYDVEFEVGRSDNHPVKAVGRTQHAPR